jgi:hypothetical protein
MKLFGKKLKKGKKFPIFKYCAGLSSFSTANVVLTGKNSLLKGKIVISTLEKNFLLGGLPLPEGFFPREEILEKEDDQPRLPRRTRANAPFLPSVEPHSIPKNKMNFSKNQRRPLTLC